MLRITHLVNPVAAPPGSELALSQSVTYDSLGTAVALAKGSVQVETLSAQLAADRRAVPRSLRPTRDLDRSVLDVASFEVPRELPLLRDIIDRLAGEASRPDVFVYTNVDIALQPYFYLTVARLIEDGLDALVVNRRTISDRFRSPTELPEMWAEIGEPHIGHDCFVFRKELASQFDLGLVCVGVRLVGRVLLWNLVAHAKNFRESGDLHLTFHIGNERRWKDPRFADYDRFNQSEALEVLRRLDRRTGLYARLKRDYPSYLAGLPEHLLGEFERS